MARETIKINVPGDKFAEVAEILAAYSAHEPGIEASYEAEDGTLRVTGDISTTYFDALNTELSRATKKP